MSSDLVGYLDQRTCVASELSLVTHRFGANAARRCPAADSIAQDRQPHPYRRPRAQTFLTTTWDVIERATATDPYSTSGNMSGYDAQAFAPGQAIARTVRTGRIRDCERRSRSMAQLRCFRCRGDRGSVHPRAWSRAWRPRFRSGQSPVAPSESDPSTGSAGVRPVVDGSPAGRTVDGVTGERTGPPNPEAPNGQWHGDHVTHR